MEKNLQKQNIKDILVKNKLNKKGVKIMSEMSANIVMALLMVILGMVIGVAISNIDYKKYDLNGDGLVNSADMLKLQKYIISQGNKGE